MLMQNHVDRIKFLLLLQLLHSSCLCVCFKVLNLRESRNIGTTDKIRKKRISYKVLKTQTFHQSFLLRFSHTLHTLASSTEPFSTVMIRDHVAAKQIGGCFCTPARMSGNLYTLSIQLRHRHCRPAGPKHTENLNGSHACRQG